jgi:tRNA threonylcarbamoyl adenosine modification protein YeaZ
VIVAIDTSARGRLIAIAVNDDGSVAERLVTSTGVLPELPQALARLMGDGVSAIVVARGPGSYTGLRAGMAVAVGVAQARSLPLHTIESLAVAAGAAPETAGRVRAVSDASRGAVYGVDYVRAGALLSRDGTAWRRPLSEVASDGADVIISCDPLAIPGLSVADPVTGLARAALAVLSDDPVAIAGLTVEYVNPPHFAEVTRSARL